MPSSGMQRFVVPDSQVATESQFSALSGDTSLSEQQRRLLTRGYDGPSAERISGFLARLQEEVQSAVERCLYGLEQEVLGCTGKTQSVLVPSLEEAPAGSGVLAEQSRSSSTVVPSPVSQYSPDLLTWSTGWDSISESTYSRQSQTGLCRGVGL